MGARPRLVRLTEVAKLHPEPQVFDANIDAADLVEIPKGELVQAIGDVDGPAHDWLLVRSPLEDMFESMSEKPLLYQDGWLYRPSFEIAEHQLGAKAAGRVDNEMHPVLEQLQKLPPWNTGQ